ncbi:hypothetical protein [Deinococcus koreensis]|uniref:Uncharacterized protein n=1 Tax=Deinococcus koreensis TaxID=2054903 RepID=A0A2K3US56_9DEIO|nr:hypothetical protein [Deinococcus koreensis]PNY79358.1 hypothetical protein CVO96_19730 [Deinococcus koreensis]
MLQQYRRRAASEPPRELRRHPAPLRHVLLAALCWERLTEVTEDLVELLVSVAHHIGTRAESRVEAEVPRHLRRVQGKSALLFKLAKAARAQPERAVRAPEPLPAPGSPLTRRSSLAARSSAASACRSAPAPGWVASRRPTSAARLVA